MKTFITFIFVAVFLTSCSSNGPEPINYNQDACEFCKMSISESHFASELITVKGRVYKFDDLQCLLQYQAANKDVAVKSFYVGNFAAENDLIDASTAFFVKNEALHSPMGGNTAAFKTAEAATEYANKNKGQVVGWNELDKTAQPEENPHHGHAH